MTSTPDNPPDKPMYNPAGGSPGGVWDDYNPDYAQPIPVGDRTGSGAVPPEEAAEAPETPDEQSQPVAAMSTTAGTPPPPPPGYRHPPLAAPDKSEGVKGMLAHTAEQLAAQQQAPNVPATGGGPSPGLPRQTRRWLSTLLGHKQTGDDFDTSQQDDGHVKNPDGATTVADLSRDNQNPAGGPTTPSSPVTEYGRTAGGGQRIGRGAKPVAATGQVSGRIPSILNENAKHGAQVVGHAVGGVAAGASSYVGGRTARWLGRSRGGWIDISEAYIHSFDTPPLGNNRYERFRLSVGYLAMRHIIAPVQAYGSPALTAGSGGAWLMSVPAESINGPQAGVFFALSALSMGVTHIRGQRELNSNNTHNNSQPR